VIKTLKGKMVALGLVAATIVLLFFASVNIKPSSTVTTEPQSLPQSNISNTQLAAVTENLQEPIAITLQDKDSQSSDVKNEVIAKINNAAEQEELTKWKLKRGTDLSHDPEYESYDSDTLRKLGNSGDIRALAVLSNKYAGYPDAKSQRFAAAARMKAAMYGSTYATKQQAIRAMQLRATAKNDTERKNLLLEGMAWYKLGLLIGDPTYYFKEIESPAYVNEGIALSAKDFEKIDEMAHRIYSSLEASRNKVGLGNFDNSMPAVVEDYFNKIDPRKNGVIGY
jgi:hypothetical protein